MFRKVTHFSLTIANGGTTSEAVQLREYVMVGLLLPATLTSTAITFTASNLEGGTYVDVYDSDGNQVSLIVAASRAIGLSGAEADALAPFEWIKVVCGSAEGAERTIVLVKK